MVGKIAGWKYQMF